MTSERLTGGWPEGSLTGVSSWTPGQRLLAYTVRGDHKLADHDGLGVLAGTAAAARA
jgi:hypothetical protein